ncbi:ead/Ea22-like family protein [Enterobacter hormaechei]|uniref:ead/Ea22-like family protein n=1 Tax=Enterobacter hormaechei TaxID=158836 RepID=UPI0032B0A234
MSNIDKRALREAAEKATKGQWAVEFDDEVYSTDGVNNEQIAMVFSENEVRDAAFIAAANPATVLALLDELEAAESRIAELEASHKNLREAMAGIHNTITAGGAYTPLAAILNSSKRAYEESAAAAGKGE